jgi:hypothetical protein
MMRVRLPAALFGLLGLLLPMMASCSQPRGTYQRAPIQEREGTLCFGVPDTRETRDAPPLIAGVTVTEVGKGNQPVWQRIFLREGAPEPAMPPDQCLTYGAGKTAAPALGAGKYYQVVLSGYTPGAPGREGEAQKRVFNACFHVEDVAGKGAVKPVVSDCATASSSALRSAQPAGK